MSAHTETHLRLYALDLLGRLGPEDSADDVADTLIFFLGAIEEATVAAAARRALERIYEG